MVCDGCFVSEFVLRGMVLLLLLLVTVVSV